MATAVEAGLVVNRVGLVVRAEETSVAAASGTVDGTERVGSEVSVAAMEAVSESGRLDSQRTSSSCISPPMDYSSGGRTRDMAVLVVLGGVATVAERVVEVVALGVDVTVGSSVGVSTVRGAAWPMTAMAAGQGAVQAVGVVQGTVESAALVEVVEMAVKTAMGVLAVRGTRCGMLPCSDHASS